MKINGVIQRKLTLLDDQLVKLEKHLENISFEQFCNDWMRQSMAERALQVAIEIVIDIADRLIALADAGPVATARDAIRKCVDLGYLASENPYSQMVGYRNFIVHQYEHIDPEITYSLATERLSDFRAFRREIDNLIMDN